MVPNPERGEVEIVLGDAKGILCAEMSKLAAFSGVIGTKTLQEVFQRLAGAEPFAMYAVLDTMVIDGDIKKLKAAIKSPAHLQLVSEAAMASLVAFLGDDNGKKENSETGKP